MHLSDGVLSVTSAVSTSLAAGGLMVPAIKSIKEEDIPKISLMTAAFFTFSLVSIPIGPSSAHPLLAGLLGITLGKRAPVSIFVALLLQAILFQHGGLTTLGINTLLVSVPALLSYWLFQKLKGKIKSLPLAAGLVGGTATFLCVLMLILILFITNTQYSQGTLSVINVLILSYIPVLVIETVLTGFTVAYIKRVRPSFFNGTFS